MHIDAKYALLLFSPDATRDRINAMDGLAATNELINLIQAPDELQRHAYIRNLVAEHNVESPAARMPLQKLGKVAEEEQEDGDEQKESGVQLTVDYTGVVTRRKVEISKKQQTAEDKLRADPVH